MPEVVKFKAFCLERYKYAHGLTGREVIDLFVRYGVLDYLSDHYDVLHSFGDRYLVDDIDGFIQIRNVN